MDVVSRLALVLRVTTRLGKLISRLIMHATARLILASASPRRRELLTEIGATFDVVVAQVTEHEDPQLV